MAPQDKAGIDAHWRRIATRMPSPPPSRPRRRADTPDAASPVWLYGRHAVAAAFRNPQRRLRRLLATKNALDWLHAEGVAYQTEVVKPAAIDAALGANAVHQGLAASFDDLPRARLKDVCAPDKAGPVLVLDQVTDPQNVGALFRIAAAFGAQALVAQDRRTPPLSGALAKAAAGALEVLPFVSVVNISRALEALSSAGFEIAGLAGEGAISLDAYRPLRPVALVLGAEGKGLREGVASSCDTLVSIPISENVESLNVSSAASVALYAVTRQQ